MKDKVLHVLDVIEGFPGTSLRTALCAHRGGHRYAHLLPVGPLLAGGVGRYVLVFGTFLGASMAIRTDDHPRMTALLVAVPHTVRQILRIVGDLICIVGPVVDYYSWLQISSMMRIGTMTSPPSLSPCGCPTSSSPSPCAPWLSAM